MNSNETTRQTIASTPGTGTRIFTTALVVTLGVFAALLVTFALLALILA